VVGAAARIVGEVFGDHVVVERPQVVGGAAQFEDVGDDEGEIKASGGRIGNC